MTDQDLTIFEDGVLDQALPIEYDSILDDIQETLYDIIDSEQDNESKANRALDVVVEMKQKVEKHGRAVVMALGIIEENWPSFGLDEEFIDYAFEKSGLHRHSIERYVKLYKSYKTHPALIDKPLKAAIPISNKLAQGFEFSDETWQKLDEAPDYQTVSSILSDYTGGSGERKNQLNLWMDRSGALWAYTKDDQRFFVGSLEVAVAKENPVIEKAIERITKNSGVLKE